MALDVDNHITIDWSCDCNEQRSILKTMLIDIEAQDEIIRDAGRQQLQIFSKNPPSTAQWQTEWLLRGNSLPLPDGLECLWYDTTNNTYGAQYYVVSGVVYPVEMIRYKGLINLKKDVDSSPNLNTSLGVSVAGLSHWDTNFGAPQAVGFVFNIPTHILGKNYFVKFSIPFAPQTAVSTNWTIWYESTNFYNTLFGGVGASGFGIFPATAQQCIIEWVAEIPAGGVVSTIEVRVASMAGAVTLLASPRMNGSPTANSGRAIAEFILKTE